MGRSCLKHGFSSEVHGISFIRVRKALKELTYVHYLLFRFVTKHYDELRVLLTFDQRLLYIIPYICPPKDLSVLCDLLPVDVAIACVCDRLSSVSIATTSEKGVSC